MRFCVPTYLNPAHSPSPSIMHPIPKDSFLLLVIPLHLLQTAFLRDYSTFRGLGSSRWSATFACLFCGLFGLSIAVFLLLIILDWCGFLFLFVALSFFILLFGLFFGGRGCFALLGGWGGWRERE